MASERLVSQREIAERSGYSTRTIADLVKAGIVPSVNGKIPLSRGLAAISRYRATKASPKKPRVIARPTGGTKDDLVAAQVRERRAKADLAELDAAVRRGELVSVADVVADARACMERIRAALLAIAPRLALQLEALTGVPAPKAEALVADEVNVALTALHETRFGGET